MVPLGPRMSMRIRPPGCTSSSQTGLAKPRGPHHRAMCLASVQALKTKLRGAPRMRVRMSSCLAWPAAELLAVSAMLLLLGLQLTQIVVKAIEFLLPSHTIVLNPVGNILKTRGMDAAGAPLGSAAACDKSSAFKDFEVLRDGGHAHLKRLGKLGDGGFAGHQVRENGSARGIGEGRKGRGESVLGVLGGHLYLTGWLNTTASFWCQAVCDETRECGPGAFHFGTGEGKASRVGAQQNDGKRRGPGGRYGKEEASRSLRAAGLFLFYFHRGCVGPEGVRIGSSVCALAKAQKLAGGLTSRSGTRAAQRAARQVFNGVDSTPGDIDDWVLAVGYALNAGFPNLLEHVQTHDYKSD